MKVRVRIKSKSIGEVLAELTDEYSPKTFNEVVKALPIEGVASIWGSEIYFPIPVFVDEENSFEVVEKGAIAYWPPGNSLCIFWGPTPASRHKDEIRPASPVNVVGRVLGDPEVFSKVRFREKIIIEKV
ncbi:MAG: cyclophilin-like family protein [Sulfolobales archaeon]